MAPAKAQIFVQFLVGVEYVLGESYAAMVRPIAVFWRETS